MVSECEREFSIDDTAGWRRALSRYQRPSVPRAVVELCVTAAPLALSWLAMIVAVRLGLYWLYPLLLALAAGFLVRLFMVQHDCGHGAFFPNQIANDWTGRAIGVLTLTPYDHWRRSHAIHHATSGNLDRRGTGDIDTLTVEEYRARSRWGRLRYRLYRHPAVMFGLGPAYLFLLESRLPFGFMRKGWMPWLSTMSTNLGIAAIVGAMVWAFGYRMVLLTYAPIAVLAGAIGVWLFYVQHQFPSAHWTRDGRWDASQAALLGSSHYDLPPVLRWFTANIGTHHVHHLSSRIPYYRLPEALSDHPTLRAVGRMTLIRKPWLSSPRAMGRGAAAAHLVQGYPCDERRPLGVTEERLGTHRA